MISDESIPKGVETHKPNYYAMCVTPLANLFIIASELDEHGDTGDRVRREILAIRDRLKQ